MAELQPITINSGTLARQPSRLREFRAYQQTDKYAIDGAVQRNRVRTPGNPNGYKFVAEMTFENLNSTDYRAIDALFVSGSGVNYYNPESGKFGILSFSGLPFTDESDEYSRGSSQQATYKVRIRQF